MGADLTRAAWPLLKQIFTGGDPKAKRTIEAPDCLSLDDVHRAPHDFLRDHPVELLVLGNLQKEPYDAWMKLIPGHRQTETPELILEFWEPWHITRNTDGPMAKLTMTRWQSLGYESSCLSANATQVGGVVDRTWLICARALSRLKTGWNWPVLSEDVIRPMANCLRPVGVPGSAYRQPTYNSHRPPPDAKDDPMPAQPGTFIRTDRGIRRLLHDELCNGLGVPKPWVLEYPDGKTVRRTVALHRTFWNT
jgi:hypothetical protein